MLIKFVLADIIEERNNTGGAGMEYISVNEAASQMGISVRRIQQMCKSGKIPGAIKKGRSWMIPSGE